MLCAYQIGTQRYSYLVVCLSGRHTTMLKMFEIWLLVIIITGRI